MSVPTRKRDTTQLITRLRQGTANGLWYGVPLALFAVVGAMVDYDGMRAKIGASPFVIAVFYLVSSVVIGALARILEKQLRSRIATLVFGFVVTIPAAAAAMLVIKGAVFTASEDGILSILIIAALIGPLGANVIRGN